MLSDKVYTMFHKKTRHFVISSYLYFDNYELHENFQNYIGGIACCEYGINIYDSLAILCQYHCNETTEKYHVDQHKIDLGPILMQNNKTPR